jgi:mRNA interferase MazF
MGAFSAGQVVLLRFPFSDLSGDKLRPAVVLAYAGRQDWIVCQITSNPLSDANAIPLSSTDFVSGGLQRASIARPGKVFTAHESLIASHIGTLKPKVLESIRDRVIQILRPL